MSSAGTAGGDLFESFAKGAGQVLGAIEHRVPFRHRAHKRALIQFRQGKAAARANGDIGIDAKQRHGRFVGFGEARKNVGDAAAAGPFADSNLSRHARVAVRHVGRRAFVAGEDVAHAVRQTRQRVIERQTGIAAESEENPHAVGFEHLHCCFRAGEGLRRCFHGCVHDLIRHLIPALLQMMAPA